MRIHFDNVNFQSKSGPNTFANRLARQFFNLGHEVLIDGGEADVSLVFIETSGRQLAKRVVQRLDGIWFKPQEFITKNTNIKKLYESADHVIWQSKFDNQMTTKWWGEPKSGSIITNGIDINPIKEISIPELLKIRSTYDQVFVCSANWHPQKRLRDNIRLFDHIRRTQHKNSCLIIMGSNPDVSVSDPHVFYTGSVPSEVYLQVYSISNWMIHLAWADHCPNVVIEALSQGTPVICSSVGGTKELIGKFGVILKDENYDYDLCDYDNPPSIKIENDFLLPDKNLLSYDEIQNTIDINNVARQYVHTFEKVISQ